MHADIWRINQTSYERWALERDQSLAKEPAAASSGPLISVVMPVFNTKPEFLISAIESVCAQTYQRWQLCVADDASTDPDVAVVLQRFAARDPRIKATFLSENAGIAGASNRAAELAEGAFVALMDHDDLLHPEALAVVVRALAKSPQAQFVYTDSDHLDEQGRRCNPFFKPDWDYSRFLGQNYLNHLTVIRRDLLTACDGWRAGYEGSQDYDLYLRIVEKISGREILHIPEVLYHWRDVPGSVARSNLGKAVQAARLAIKHHFDRAGVDAMVKGCANAIIYNRIEWPTPAASVDLVVHGESERELDEARAFLSVGDHHLPLRISSIVCVRNGRQLLGAVNEILSASAGDFFCIMDARLRPTKQDWLKRLASIANRPGVGAVTAKLMRGDGRLAFGPNHQARADLAGEASQFWEREQSKGYIASLCLDQEVARAPSALLLAKASLFSQLLASPADCDTPDTVVELLCERLAEQGQSLIWSPHVQFRIGGSDEQVLSPLSADRAEAYAASIPTRLAPNPNHGEVQWEVVWSKDAG